MLHRPIGLKRIQAMTSVLIAMAVVGCSTTTASLPPDTSVVNAPFRQTPSAITEAQNATTWRGFGDPVLDGLVERARVANLDVHIAAQRVRQARAGSTAAATRLWPRIAVTSSLSDQRTGLPDAIKRGLPDTRAARGAIDLGWELDVFGAAGAAADAAEFDALSAEAGVEVAQWLATTEVARQYLIWQGARVRLEQMQGLLATQRDTERLTRSRQAEGVASSFDISRAAGEVQTLAAQLPPLHTLVAVTEHQIDVLLGTAPSASALNWRTVAPFGLPSVPALTPGQPAELLQRRPDLRLAQQQLLAESARLRESQADLWPKFFIAAVLGRQDLRLNLLDLSPSRFSNVALAFTAPLFNAGRLRAAVEQQSASERIATLRYERAVISALQDVENSLVSLAQEQERGKTLLAAVESRRIGLGHAESLHREGQIDLLQLLDAQRGLIAAEIAVTDSLTQRALGAVQLVKALGGGWYTAPAMVSSTTNQP